MEIEIFPGDITRRGHKIICAREEFGKDLLAADFGAPPSTFYVRAFPAKGEEIEESN